MTKSEYINLPDTDIHLTPQEKAYRAVQRANEKIVADKAKAKN